MQKKEDIKKALEDAKKKRKEEESKKEKEESNNKKNEEKDVNKKKKEKKDEERDNKKDEEYSKLFKKYLERKYPNITNQDDIQFNSDKEFVDFFVGFLTFYNKFNGDEEANSGNEKTKHELLALFREASLSGKAVDKMLFAEKLKTTGVPPIKLSNGVEIDPTFVYLNNRFNYNNEITFPRNSIYDPLHLLSTSQMEDATRSTVLFGNLETMGEKKELNQIVYNMVRANALMKDNRDELAKFKKHKEDVEKFRKSDDFKDMQKDLDIMMDMSLLGLMILINPIFAIIYYSIKKDMSLEKSSLGGTLFGDLVNGVENFKKDYIKGAINGLIYDVPFYLEDYAHKNYLKDFEKSKKELQEYKDYMWNKIEDPEVKKEVAKLIRKETLNPEVISDYEAFKYYLGEKDVAKIKEERQMLSKFDRKDEDDKEDDDSGDDANAKILKDNGDEKKGFYGGGGDSAEVDKQKLDEKNANDDKKHENANSGEYPKQNATNDKVQSNKQRDDKKNDKDRAIEIANKTIMNTQQRKLQQNNNKLPSDSERENKDNGPNNRKPVDNNQRQADESDRDVLVKKNNVLDTTQNQNNRISIKNDNTEREKTERKRVEEAERKNTESYRQSGEQLVNNIKNSIESLVNANKNEKNNANEKRIEDK